MSDAKVTSKGQITIPKAVRERLHLAPGDRVYFDIRDDGSVRFVARNRPLERLFGMLDGKTKARGVTIEKMNPASDPDYDV
jgi:AbrB family looped-hinge helix DNA binding protein